MRACYINLDTAVERRRQLEADFALVPSAGWTLQRFPAVTAADVAQAPGRLRPTEKACFESHRRLIGRHLDDEAPLFVLEDDVVFSRPAFPLLTEMLQRPEDWDLLYTDLALVQPARIVEAVRTRERLGGAGEVATAALGGAAFVGATAYLVRGGSKARLHRLLVEASELDTPYDVYLNQRVMAGDLKAAVCLPFLTTPSEHGSRSQIRPEAPVSHRAFDLFRRLMFIERDLDACSDAARALEACLSAPERVLGTLVGALSLP